MYLFYFRQFTQEPIEAVHMEKTRHVYLEVEPGIWMAIEVDNPNLNEL